MIRLSNLKLPPIKAESDDKLLLRLKLETVKKMRIKNDDIIDIKLVKKSIDARKLKEISVVCTVDVLLKDFVENRVVSNPQIKNVSKVNNTEYIPIRKKLNVPSKKPVIVGAGPAGLFCAYILALNGFKPIIIERGQSVEERKRIVDKFWDENILDTECNVQFGEGGAGTFSDGKLNTQIKDKTGRIAFVLKTFIENGANASIAYDQKPHVGTDVLIKVVKNLREEIKALGGTFFFESCLVDIDIVEGKLQGLFIKDKEKSYRIDTDDCVLAIGHSARDTFYMLNEKSIMISPKSFAVGYRVMHEQIMVDKSQYGDCYDYFGSAPYKLTYNTQEKRGVFSFCNCPGGYVVNASSEDGRLAVNGMSYSGRDSGVANSAIIVQIDPSDYGNNEDPLSGVEFQRLIEKKAYKIGNGKIPLQRFADYKANVNTESAGKINPCIKGQFEFANLRGILPEILEDSFIEGMTNFGRKIKGFDGDDVLIAGVESRTSSPIRIERFDNGYSSISGIYPCGEGAGYAGGITSAAVDGIKVAEYIMNNYE